VFEDLLVRGQGLSRVRHPVAVQLAEPIAT